MVPMHGISSQSRLSDIEKFDMTHVKIFKPFRRNDMRSVKILIKPIDPFVIVTKVFSVIYGISGERFSS